MNTCLMSQAMVAGDGRWYSGHPVFIRSLKPWSFTIAKGRLLSVIQRTISILVQMYHSFLISSKLNNISCLCVCVLTMRIGGLFLTDELKSLHPLNLSYCLQRWLLYRPSTFLHAGAGYLSILHRQYPGSNVHHSHASPCSGRPHTQRHVLVACQHIQYGVCDWRTHILGKPILFLGSLGIRDEQHSVEYIIICILNFACALSAGFSEMMSSSLSSTLHTRWSRLISMLPSPLLSSLLTGLMPREALEREGSSLSSSSSSSFVLLIHYVNLKRVNE